MLLQCGDLCLPYAFCRYDKNKQSKIDWVCECLETLPVFQRPAYLLVDTWYNSCRIIHTSLKKGLYLIGGLKTNRVLFPQGIYAQAKYFASMITEADTHLVTMGEASYHVYRYEGACKGLDHVVVLFCWPKGQVRKLSSLRCFLSMNLSLSDEQILSFYEKRWSIEVFFQFMKEKFSFDRYQMRSTRSIDRFWALLFLAYEYVLQANESVFVADCAASGKCRMQLVVAWIYSQSQRGVSLERIQNDLNVA